MERTYECPPVLLLLLGISLFSAPPQKVSLELKASVIDEQRAHRRSSFFRAEDVKEHSRRKRVFLNRRLTNVGPVRQFSRPFYYVEETSAPRRRIAYLVSEIEYKAQGKIAGYRETGAREAGEYKFKRSDITYNAFGKIDSYKEKGVDTGGVHYQFDRAQMNYHHDRLVAFTERGQRDGTHYSLHRTDITYDRQGQLTSYREAGQIQRRGARTRYELTRSGMQYEEGMLTGYQESGSNDGEAYVYHRKNIEYSGDRMVAFSETGECGDDTYQLSRSQITYEGDEVIGYQEGGSEGKRKLKHRHQTPRRPPRSSN